MGRQVRTNHRLHWAEPNWMLLDSFLRWQISIAFDRSDRTRAMACWSYDTWLNDIVWLDRWFVVLEAPRSFWLDDVTRMVMPCWKGGSLYWLGTDRSCSPGSTRGPLIRQNGWRTQAVYCILCLPHCMQLYSRALSPRLDGSASGEIKLSSKRLLSTGCLPKGCLNSSVKHWRLIDHKFQPINEGQ